MKDKNNETVGDRLVKLRKKYNFTQKQIAEYLGYNQSHIAKIEKNQRNLQVDSLEKLSDLYLCSDEYILYGNGNYSKPKFAFRAENYNVDLQTISEINRIIKNLEFLDKLDKYTNKR